MVVLYSVTILVLQYIFVTNSSIVLPFLCSPPSAAHSPPRRARARKPLISLHSALLRFWYLSYVRTPCYELYEETPGSCAVGEVNTDQLKKRNFHLGSYLPGSPISSETHREACMRNTPKCSTIGRIDLHGLDGPPAVFLPDRS